MRSEYDYILIDSRTGVSDTSGICTVQMPDILVVCFTLNNQSIDGAAAVAASVFEQRKGSGLKIFPVPMRIENSEAQKLENRWDCARKKLASFPNSISARKREKYWRDVAISYMPYYAYEEVLATIADKLRIILPSFERLTSYLIEKDVKETVFLPEPERQKIIAAYEGVALDKQRIMKKTTDEKALQNVAISVEQPAHNTFFNLPIARNQFFTGREHIFKDLRNALTKNSATALSQAQAISGLGGIGKTQIAVEYAYQYRDEYSAVFWVQADSHLTLTAGFVEIARALNLAEKDAQNPDDAVRAVSRWLEDNAGWLLIFDNADEPELIKSFRPRNPKGHILITSRAQVFDALGIANPVEIEAMRPDEALNFLFKRTGRDDGNADEKDAATHLADELGYLPLALEQAGAFITAKRARFRDYLASYRRRRSKLLEESRPVFGNYHASVTTTWAMNFKEVEAISEAASDLLCVSAFLSPDSIPLELLAKGKSELGPALSAALADAEEDPLVLNQVLEPLTRYSLILLDIDSQTYEIHRLVQAVLKDMMDEHTRRLWAERAISSLSETFPSVEYENWPISERLLPHAKVAAKLIAEWSFTFEKGWILLNRAALYCRGRGGYAEADSLQTQSLMIIEQALGFEHPDVALSLNNLAEIYSEQGKYDDAEPLYKRALVIYEKALGPEHPNVAISLNNLAALYVYQGRYTDAEPLLLRSLAISEKVLGPEHPNVATSLSGLAMLYLDQSKYTDAEPLLLRSLAIREKTLGSDHPSVATSLYNLALLYLSQSKYAQAEPLLLKSLTITEKVLGPDHPSVATILTSYADLLRATGREMSAAEMQARANLIQREYSENNQ